MVTKYEIKTLKQNMEGRIGSEDKELTEALNEGWEIIPSLSTMSAIASTYGDSDQFTSYALYRIVTLRRAIPSAEALSTKALMKLSNLIWKNYPETSVVGTLRRQWVDEDISPETYLASLNARSDAMPENVKRALQEAENAHEAHLAAMGDD